MHELNTTVRILALCMAIAAGTAQAGALLETYRQAVDHDAVLQSAFYQRASSVEVRPQAVAQFMPQLDASAGIRRERDAYPATAGAPLQSFYGTGRNYGLTLSQTIWDLQSFHQLKEASLQVAQAESIYRSAQQNLILRVAQAYFAILSAADELATNRNERQAFGDMLRQAQIREQTGVGPRSDVEQAQSFYDATEQSVIDAGNALDDAQRALAEITGRDLDTLEPLQDDIPLVAPTPASPDDWVAAAREDNFDARAAALKTEAALRDISAKQAQYWPTLALQGSGSRSRENFAIGGDKDLGSIGLMLNWQIFQGGTVQSLVRQAQASYLQTKADYDVIQRATERSTRAAFRGVASGVERIRAGQRAANSNRIAVEASRRNVEFGTGNEFDLLNAQNNYYSVVRAYQQSRYDYLTAVLQLKQQAGRLTEDDLASIDRLLVTTPTAPAGDSPHVP